CLGLFGLSAYAAQQRTREIGIRKVLGASVTAIIVSLSKDFLWLTVAAIAIAIPVAWWATGKWLQDFTYRTGIGIGLYVIAAAAIFLLAMLTVSIEALRAAQANPVKSLKTE
ncbi:MAG TPA: FtsX-like permease family protein, partial [Chitinophagaceae bacterium]